MTSTDHPSLRLQQTCRSTIIACCTPTGGTGGSLALLRLSGPDAFLIAGRCLRLSSGIAIVDVPSHTVHHGYVHDALGNRLDEVMAIVMQGPRTFTGEDTVEITCHQNQIIIQAISDACVSAGARPAQRGEFTQQAFLNKKLDLSQAEAIHELIHATTAQSVRASLAQLSGTLSHMMAQIEQRLLIATSWCEASFEFVDDVASFGTAVKDQITSIIETLASLQRIYSTQTHLREGLRIALVGSVNAGKSSLFNTLIGKERAIVTPIAGTTRDSIEATILRSTLFWTLIDTAGLRITDDAIEQEGIVRSRKEAAAADLVLLVVDATRAATTEEIVSYTTLRAAHGTSILVVYNKCDNENTSYPELPVLAGLPHSTVSAQTQRGIALLEKMINDRLAALVSDAAAPYIINQRHHETCTLLHEQLTAVLALCSDSEPPYELISVHLQQALETLGEVTGKTVSEAALDRIFREFCIGK